MYIVIKVVTQNFSQQISKQQTKEIFRGVFFQILCYQTEIKVDSTPPVVFLIGTGIFHSMYKHYFRMSLLFSSYLGSHFCHYPLQVSSGFRCYNHYCLELSVITPGYVWAQALGYPGLHNLFALLIYPGLGLTTENL